MIASLSVSASSSSDSAVSASTSFSLSGLSSSGVSLVSDASSVLSEASSSASVSFSDPSVSTSEPLSDDSTSSDSSLDSSSLESDARLSAILALSAPKSPTAILSLTFSTMASNASVSMSLARVSSISDFKSAKDCLSSAILASSSSWLISQSFRGFPSQSSFRYSSLLSVTNRCSPS